MSQEFVPVNSLPRHIAPIAGELVEAMGAVVTSGYYVLGPSVKAFEQEFAAYCGVAHCIGVGNGTDALELALRALDMGPGRRVALTANAAMYATSAVLACSAEPVFVDTRADDGTLDPVALERTLMGGRVDCVIATHLYGQLADMDRLVGLCTSRGIPVLEDCAQAHGATGWDGRRAGAFGTIGAFSFYPTKNLGALGDGGGVVTPDDALADRVRKLRQYGWGRKYTNALAGGRNSRLDELQARALSVMLPRLDGWNDARRAIAMRYGREIRNARLCLPKSTGRDYVAHLYVIRCDDREGLRRHLEQAGIQSDVHYPVPDHRQPCHNGRWDHVVLPNTEADAATVLTLPCFPELSPNEVQRVIDACNSF